MSRIQRAFNVASTDLVNCMLSGDFNGDGVEEFVAGQEDGLVLLYDADGKLLRVAETGSKAVVVLAAVQVSDQEPAAALLERIERQRHVSTIAGKEKRTNNVRSGRP